MVLAAVTKIWDALQYASKELRLDLEVVREAVVEYRDAANSSPAARWLYRNTLQLALEDWAQV
eukprot:SAG25_NODE_528_length_7179_cov_40.901836_4_plen_63_part_00